MARKDDRGRNLRTGESQRDDGRYMYRYTDKKTGKRIAIYHTDLAELRSMERNIQRDMEDGITTASEYEKMDINALFEWYMSMRELSESTRTNYCRIWDNHVKETLGKIKVKELKKSEIKKLYSEMSKKNYSQSIIKCLNNMLYPALELAVEDDIIRKNPAKGTIEDYGRPPKERKAFTVQEQEIFLEFIRKNNTYNCYLPMFEIMLGTGCRVGELIGLTWSDIDMKLCEVSISHQLIYKNYGDGYKFHLISPKTEAGIRIIPMTFQVRKAFEQQREYQLMMGIKRDFDVEGMKGFIFVSKHGRPLMPSAVNNVLYNIVKTYNALEKLQADRDKRKEILLPNISAHIMRHTACTRMAENGMDPKVLQYIMGHAEISVTMDVYNHITEKGRVAKEMKKMERLRAV